MAMPLDKAVDLAVRRTFPPDNVKVSGHDFFIRALVPSDLIQKGETGYFRHIHIGKDDRVFYSIEVLDKKKGTFIGRITRIQFRGPLNSGLKKFGPTGAVIAGSVAGATAALPVIPEVAGAVAIILKVIPANFQALLDGDFASAAVKIIDAIGRRMATG
jgi:hypothetical protein